MNRRSFLKLSGGITIVVGAGRVCRSFAQNLPEIGEGPELELWRTWRTDLSVGVLRLVHAAILSANAYNSQPWIFRVTEKQVDVYADVRRNLGDFDPYLREMFFSIGCALENLEVAAVANGYRCSTKLIPGELSLVSQDVRPSLAATIRLASAKRRPSELYDAIPHRHTNREPFDTTKPLPDSFIPELSVLARSESRAKLFAFSDPERLQRIVGVISSSTGKFLGDPQVRKSVQPWIRTTPEQMRRSRDGFLLDAQASRYGTLEAYASLMRTGRMFGIIAVRDRYDRAQTMSAGRIWQRAHLLATSRGIAARPANGAVELMDHERQRGLPADAAESLAAFTGDGSWQPTFMFYMGYPMVQAQASPRRPLEDVLVKSTEAGQAQETPGDGKGVSS